jgi:hypothetical protein
LKRAKGEQIRDLLDRLLAWPGEESEARARDREYRSLPLAALLLLESEAVQPLDPARSMEIARLALIVASHLYPAELVSRRREIQKLAYGVLDGAYRRLGDFAAAEELIALAEEHFGALPRR